MRTDMEIDGEAVSPKAEMFSKSAVQAAAISCAKRRDYVVEALRAGAVTQQEAKLEKYSTGPARSEYANAASAMAAPIGHTQIAPPAPAPDSLRGVISAMDTLAEKASALANHATDIRENLCGSFPRPDDAKAYPQSVPNGLIEEMMDRLSRIERGLRGAEESLEIVWGKVG
jgi:hypothetical protein